MFTEKSKNTQRTLKLEHNGRIYFSLSLALSLSRCFTWSLSRCLSWSLSLPWSFEVTLTFGIWHFADLIEESAFDGISPFLLLLLLLLLLSSLTRFFLSSKGNEGHSNRKTGTRHQFSNVNLWYNLPKRWPTPRPPGPYLIFTRSGRTA